MSAIAAAAGGAGGAVAAAGPQAGIGRHPLRQMCGSSRWSPVSWKPWIHPRASAKSVHPYEGTGRDLFTVQKRVDYDKELAVVRPYGSTSSSPPLGARLPVRAHGGAAAGSG